MLYESFPLQRKHWSLEMDLNSDFHLLIKAEMKKIGIEPSGTRDIVYEFFNTMKRIIAIRPRKVLKSNEFLCPEEYKRALEEFENNVKNGTNLNRYLSDQIKQPERSDDLLNDWNIFHFHLTKRFRDDGFARRSDYQIFAWVTDECIYMIQVYPHSSEYLYCKKEMIEILENNWPELLEHSKMMGIEGLETRLNDAEYSQLREAHITTLVQTGEQKIYGLIGGGYMSDGSSGEAVRNADFWHNQLKKCEDIIENNMVKIIEIIEKMRGCHMSAHCMIRLLLLPGLADEITVIEVNNYIGIQLLLKEGRLRVYKIEDEVKLDSDSKLTQT